MEAIITAALALAGQVAPLVTTSTAVGSVITVLETALPAAIQFAESAVPLIEQTIADLRQNTAITADQLAALDAIEAKLDTDYDTAAASASAEDAAATAAKPSGT